MDTHRNLGFMPWRKKVLGVLSSTFLVMLLSVFSVFATSQQQKTSGKVTDKNGEPLPGVAIMVKGTQRGVVSNVDGEFTIASDTGETLQFSFVGFKMKEVKLSSLFTLAVILDEDAIGLDEVVAVGYGTMRKSDLTGAVTRVSMEEKSLQANLNILQSLSGSSAGVNIQQSGGAGSEPDLNIRGKTSLSASDSPLIVLDGIIYNGDIADINVSDVESIDILKDASASAVYGSRSSNGVMLIKTKEGKSEKPQISFNMYYGFQNMTNNPMDVMDADQYALRLVDYYYQQDLYTWYKTNPTSNSGKPEYPDISDKEVVASRLRTQEEKDNYIAGNEIDWVDEVVQTAPIQNYNLSYSGSTDKTKYFVSGSYTEEEGILSNDEFSRVTMRANIDSDITEWLNIGVNTSYSYRDYSGLPASLYYARVASPLADNKIGSPDYDMYLTGESYMRYPLIDLYIDNSDTRNNLFLVGKATVKIPWIDGLKYDVNYSNTYYTRSNFTFWPDTHPDGSSNDGKGRKDHIEKRSWIVNNIVSYAKNIGQHNINTTLLYSREHQDQNTSRLEATGFENQALGYNGLGLGTISTVSTKENGGTWEENGISYMARMSYAYRDRYFLTGTVRHDGYSGFGANNKFATFPSVSMGWILSDEDFANDFPYLKIRASYGVNGNQGLGRYKSFSTMSTRSYVYGSETSIGVYPGSALGNDNLKWEKTKSFNLGIDYAFLDQRLSGSVEFYDANTSDVLVQRALPAASGYKEVYSNIGGINNKGVELTLNSTNIESTPNGIGWTSNLAFSLNRNKITKLYGDSNDKDIGNEWFVGESISAEYDYEMVGDVWTEEEFYNGEVYEGWYPGQIKYVDQNKDGKIDPNDDRTIVGYSDPNFRISLNNTITYQNFTLSFLLNSIVGGNDYYIKDNKDILNTNFRSDNVYRTNMSSVRQYWTPENGVTNATGIYNSPSVSSGIYQSRGFVRLQDISLSYRIKPSLLKKMNMTNLQFFLSGKNVYTWTDWSGWDPETGTSNTPLMRSYTLGLRLTL